MNSYNPTTSYDMRTFGRTHELRDKLLGEFPKFLPSFHDSNSFPHQFYVSTPDPGSNFLRRKYGIIEDRNPLFIESRGAFGRDNLGFMTFDSNYKNSQLFGVHFFPGKTRGRKGMEYIVLNQFQRALNSRQLLTYEELAHLEEKLGIIAFQERQQAHNHEKTLIQDEVDRGAEIHVLYGIGHNSQQDLRVTIPSERDIRDRLAA